MSRYEGYRKRKGRKISSKNERVGDVGNFYGLRSTVRRAERKVEQLEILVGALTFFVALFFGITLWLELAGLPALTMALFLLVSVLIWCYAWRACVKARKNILRIRQQNNQN